MPDAIIFINDRPTEFKIVQHFLPLDTMRCSGRFPDVATRPAQGG